MAKGKQQSSKNYEVNEPVALTKRTTIQEVRRKVLEGAYVAGAREEEGASRIDS